MTVLQRIEYALLCLALMALPLSWNVCLWVMAALAIVAVVRAVAERSYSRVPVLNRWVGAGLIALVGWYAASLLWTANMEFGIREVLGKGFLAVGGMVLILGDFHYLNRERTDRIFSLFTIELCLIALASWGVECYKVLASTGGAAHFYWMHHTYMAMYVMLGYVWVMNKLRCKTDWMLVLEALLLCTLMVGINSKAGLLCMGVVTALFIIFGVVKKNMKWCGLVFVLGICTIAGTYLAHPMQHNHKEKVSVWLGDDATGNNPFETWETSGNSLMRVNPIIGAGAGDYLDELAVGYAEQGQMENIRRGYNSHNTYLDTTLATGVIGLIILVCVICGGFVMALNRKDMVMTMALVVITSTMMLESILERQMGCLFFSWVLMMCAATSGQRFKQSEFES